MSIEIIKLNPFQSMIDRFNIAADILKLDKSIRQKLQKPRKQIVVNFSIKLDNGNIYTNLYDSNLFFPLAVMILQNNYFHSENVIRM